MHESRMTARQYYVLGSQLKLKLADIYYKVSPLDNYWELDLNIRYVYPSDPRKVLWLLKIFYTKV